MNGDYIPISTRALTEQIGRKRNVPVRLRFEPFGRPWVGHAGKGRNRILYADAYLSYTFTSGTEPTLWFDAGGVKYVLTDGARFRDPEWEYWDIAPEAGSLEDCGRVLGREASDGSGFVPVGVGVEVSVED
jgi:hypothetical protein